MSDAIARAALVALGVVAVSVVIGFPPAWIRDFERALRKEKRP